MRRVKKFGIVCTLVGMLAIVVVQAVGAQPDGPKYHPTKPDYHPSHPGHPSWPPPPPTLADYVIPHEGNEGAVSLQEAADIIAIERIWSAYAHYLDSGDAEGVASLFTP